MKKAFAIIFLSSLLYTISARAQWVVYDPANTIQSVINTAQEIAKYIEMINNQVQQINALTSQLEELERYNDAFGNPASLLNITGANGLVQDLQKITVGKTITQVQDLAKGADALTYDARELYDKVGKTFTTPSGEEIPRDEDKYRPYAAINRATENYSNVLADVLQRRKTLKEQIAATTQRLQSATTDAEVQKLTGVLVGYNAALTATDKEIDQAATLALIQEAENRNDREKQARARAEEQQAEFNESFRNYGQTFRLSNEPPLFPETRK
jgi:type IV secretion system protein TrbJ